MNYNGYADYGYTDYDAAAGILGGIAILFIVIMLIALAVSIIQLIGMWKVFKKAGKGGWECLIPFYKDYVFIEISGLNWWWYLITWSPLVLGFIGLAWLAPFVSLFVLFNTCYNLSKKFDKGIGFAICLTLFAPICIPILGFSKNNVYNNVSVSNNGVFGPSGNNNNNMNNSGYNNNYNNMNSNVNYNYQNDNMINNEQQVGPSTESNNYNNQNIDSAQPQQFSFCGNCGTKLDSNVRFCPNCGKERI